MSKIITSRIKLKCDTPYNWANSQLIPLSGELILYQPNDEFPYPRLKVGDGFTAVTALQFVAGEVAEAVQQQIRDDLMFQLTHNGTTEVATKQYVDDLFATNIQSLEDIIDESGVLE